MGKKTYFGLSALIIASALIIGFIPPSFGNPGQGKPLAEARLALEGELAAVPGFAGIAHSESEGVIIVYLENKQARGIAPDRFEGFGVRKEISGRFHALGAQVETAAAVSGERKGAVRPLVGGISLSTIAGGNWAWAGTLGLVTYDGWILSNAHVIAMDEKNNFLEAGTPVIQPGSLDGGKDEENIVGVLSDYVEIIFSKPGSPVPNLIDAAIATLEVDGYAGWQYAEDGDYRISGTAEVAEENTVRKSGRTTGVTINTVAVVNWSGWVSYGRGDRAYFVDQVLVHQPFADSGDSGSAVDRGGAFAGLVFAGSDTYSVVNKAGHIVDLLYIRAGDIEEAVNVDLGTDRAEYPPGSSAAMVTAVVSGEEGNPISGLTYDDFETTLNGENVNPAFREEEDIPGTYTAEVDISDLEEGSHIIRVTATDSRGISGAGRVEFKIAAEKEAAAVRVASIAYATRGGPNRDRHLDIILSLKDSEGNPVADAGVSATVQRDDGSSWNFRGGTDSAGSVTFTLINHGPGCYTTEVIGVDAGELNWDGETPDNEYCK